MVHFVSSDLNASLLESPSSSHPRRSPQHVLRLPFASLGAGLLCASVVSQATVVKEPHTETAFPGEFCYVTKTRCPRIVGTGVRAKRLLGIKNIDVYAMALYVDADGARGVLAHKFRGAAPDQLAKNQQLFDELVAAEGVEKTLSLVMTSGLVKRENFLHALAERLEPPLKKAGDTTSLELFKRLFDGVEFRKTLPLAFTATRKGLVTQVDGKEVGVVPSKQFVRAFFDMYIGSDPVSKSAKDSFGKGLASMVLA